MENKCGVSSMTEKEKTKINVRCEVAYYEIEQVFQLLCYYHEDALAEELLDIKRRLILFTQRLENEI